MSLLLPPQVCTEFEQNLCSSQDSIYTFGETHEIKPSKLKKQHSRTLSLSPEEITFIERAFKTYRDDSIREVVLTKNSIIEGLLKKISQIESQYSSIMEKILDCHIKEEIEEILSVQGIPLSSKSEFFERLIHLKQINEFSERKISEYLRLVLPSPTTDFNQQLCVQSSSSQTLPPITVSVQTASKPSLSCKNLPPLSLTPAFITDETRWELLKQKNRAHDKQINSIAISDCEQYLASASADKKIKIWNLITLELIRTLKGHKQTVRSVSFLGDRVVSGSEDNTIKIWENEKCVKTLNIHSDDVNCVCVSNCKRLIVSGSFDRTVKVYSLQEDKTVRTLTGHSNSVVSVALSSNDRKIASGSWDMTIKVWKTDTGELLMTLIKHTAIVSCVCWYGEFIVSCSGDRTIVKWNRRTGQDILTLCGHGGEVMSVDTKDNLIVSLGVDDQILAWNASTNRTLQNLKGHGSYKEDYAMSVKCLDRGKFIVSGGKDRDLKVWRKVK